MNIDVKFFYNNGNIDVLNGNDALILLDDLLVCNCLVGVKLTYLVPIILKNGAISKREVTTKYVVSDLVNNINEISCKDNIELISIVKKSILAILNLYEKLLENNRSR